MEGSIVVEGVLASCYVFPDHDLAHTGTILIRWFPEVMEWLLGVEDGSLGYVKVAEKVGTWMLSHDLFY